MTRIQVNIDEHPCFGTSGHHECGRIHLPVAPRCNISCNYCDRRFHCVNQSRPGVTRRVMTPAEAMDFITKNDTPENALTVAGIAGPGEPLFNQPTFETLRLLDDHHPRLTKCISTNGLLLLDKVDELAALNVSTVTVTMNALSVETSRRIYRLPPRLIRGATETEIHRYFLQRQQDGLTAAVEAGMIVKVNTVLLPGINQDEINDIACFAEERGAYIMNVMPLIPQGKLKDLPAPTVPQVAFAKIIAGRHMNLLQNCGQCRADAVGKLADAAGMCGAA
ncbi:MAG: radical SAM protein [Propioniciclava sp.]|uniref:radical SAM protein n=1 Tax=Propioniciclava sp. TaxID=2038686 RepID=UPI0039E5A2A0